MKDFVAEEFQGMVNELLTRHKSILDTLSKFQDSNARVNRAVIKSVTNCGCIKIDGKKQAIPENVSLEDIHKFMSTQVKGKLCDNCRDAVEKEIGANLFYLAGLCNILGLSMYDIMIKEQERLDTLGKFHLR